MILTVAAVVAQATAAPSPAPTQSPLAQDTKIDANAKAWYEALIAGKLLDASQLSDKLQKALTPDILAKTGEVGTQGGALNLFQFNKGVAIGGERVYAYYVKMANGDLQFIYQLGPDGKIDGLWIKPIQ